MILDSLYDPAPARHWLTANGGRLLAAPEIANLKVRPIVGEVWLLPVSWSKSGTVAVGLNPRFPDTPPQFFLPYEARKDEIIPHVAAEDGFICTIKPGTGVDPVSSVEVIKDLLRKAEALVTKLYSPDAWTSEVEKELSAYWTINPAFSLHHFLESIPKSLAVSTLRMDENRPLFRIATLQPANAATFKQVAVCVICPRSSLKPLLLDPAAWLRDSGVLAPAIRSLFEATAGRGIPIKMSELEFLIFCETSAGQVLLPAKLKSKIKLKGHSQEEVLANVCRKLAEEGLLRGSAEDCSARRLMRRSKGPEAEDYSRLRVTIVGCGSLGGFVADLLARAGVRYFLLIDPERLKVENLPRHACGLQFIDLPKATALKAHLTGILPDAEIQDVPADFRDDVAVKAIQDFSADVTLVAVGETNADLTAARFCQAGLLPNIVFSWVEPKLAAGHLVCLPTGDETGLTDLFEPENGHYLHRVVDQPGDHQLQERGCQATYLPFSGMDLVGFSTTVAKQILALATDPPLARKIFRYSGPSLQKHEEL